MTKETPKWLQAGSYAARLDRHVIEELFRRQNRVMRGLQVTQRATGAGFFVDISPGSAIVMGTTQTDQGAYLCRASGTIPEPLNASLTPAANRTDGIYLVVNDPNAGGAGSNDFTFKWVDGGTAVPTDSILLASVARTAGESAILNAAITDMRPLGEWSWTVSPVAPTAANKGVPGDLWVVCP